MNNKCKFLIKGFNKLKCTKLKKEITFADCKNCVYFERKPIKTNKYTNKQTSVLKRTKTPLKQKSSKLAKLEKNRYSILTSNLDRCIVCGSKYNIAKHEIFYGKNRLNSIKYGLIIPLCITHHTNTKEGIHFNKELNNYYKYLAFVEFEKKYPTLKFVDIFKRNYLDK